MDWEFLTGTPMPPQSQLLHGCFLEAERADRVAQSLDGLRAALADSLHGHMVALTEEIRKSAKLLRDLGGRGPAHMPRAPAVANHLNVLLPCLSRSLRDITARCDDKTVSRELRWRGLYHAFVKESGGGLGPPQRFMVYNDFLAQLLCLLTRDGGHDPARLEALRARILDLRHRRGIPAPVQSPTEAAVATIADGGRGGGGPHQLIRRGFAAPRGPGGPSDALVAAVVPQPPRSRAHWCEQVFAPPLSSRTDMGLPERSRAFGPFTAAALPPPSARRVLVRRAFDGGRLGVELVENAAAGGAPWVVVAVPQQGGGDGGRVLTSARGCHELCVRRERNALFLMRWSRSEGCAKDWVVLCFVTWEELVLFYCTFVALKARNHLTVSIDPAEFKLKGETRLFQAQIIDDGYKHSLLVYRDNRTGGVRLQAAAWDGELWRCPVWTAFVTHICASPTWLVTADRHLVLVKEIRLYVFCHRYRESRMRQNLSGVFEIYFVGEQAADKFREVFSPLPAESLPPPRAEECIAGPSHSA